MPVFESSRKIQLFGSSLAITIPALFVKAREIDKGSVMDIIYGLDGVMVVSDNEDPKLIIDKLYEIIDKLDEKLFKKYSVENGSG